MKQLLTFSLLLFIASIVMPGCKKNHEPENPSGEKFSLSLAAHHSFNNDRLVIYVDGKPVFNEKVTSNPTIGYAGGTKVTVNAGQHTIKVVINGIVTKKQSITVSADVYVGINYKVQGSQVSFLVQDHPFGYD